MIFGGGHYPKMGEYIYIVIFAKKCDDFVYIDNKVWKSKEKTVSENKSNSVSIISSIIP